MAGRISWRYNIWSRSLQDLRQPEGPGRSSPFGYGKRLSGILQVLNSGLQFSSLMGASDLLRASGMVSVPWETNSIMWNLLHSSAVFEGKTQLLVESSAMLSLLYALTSWRQELNLWHSQCSDFTVVSWNSIPGQTFQCDVCASWVTDNLIFVLGLRAPQITFFFCLSILIPGLFWNKKSKSHGMTSEWFLVVWRTQSIVHRLLFYINVFRWAASPPQCKP